MDGAYGCLRAFAKLKSEFKHLKVVLSIGGGGKGGEHFASVAQDEEKRRRFACTSHKIVVDYGLNGIDSTYPTTLASDCMQFYCEGISDTYTHQ